MLGKAAFALTASMPSSAFAGTLAGGSAPGIPWLRLLLSFGICIAIAFGAILLLKHFQRRGIANPLKGLLDRQGKPPARRITILETRRASIHADLCLVEYDDETFLLALTPAGATVLKRSGRETAE